MRITVVGTGYVGLVTGVCFAEMGHTVTCVDVDLAKIEMLRTGKSPIYEPGVEALLSHNLRQERLFFTTQLEHSVQDAHAIFLALPTPSGEDGSADLKYVLRVAEQLGELIKKYTVVIGKSTVPVGTAEKVREAIARKCAVPFDVVSNPEFLREGMAVEDFMKPDRIVLGLQSAKAKAMLEELYAPFVRQGNPILFMDVRSAELTKYAANAFLAMKISFMNEIANLCERVGADVDMVRKGLGSDNRIGKQFLFPGIGYGGSCFPKDVQALAKTSAQHNYNFKILNAVMEVNNTQKQILIPKIKAHFQDNLEGKVIAFWGLSFKPRTDDIREAPSLENIQTLLNMGAIIHANDPEAMPNTKRLFGDRVKFFNTPYDAAEGADAIFIATEWLDFRAPDFDRLSCIMKSKVIFDGRNLYKAAIMQELQFAYYSIGRK